METIILLGLLGAGAYHMNDAPQEEQLSVHCCSSEQGASNNQGLDQLDWSKAGNFRVTSTYNKVTWIVATAD
jgi:hypothetical protein